MIVSTVHLVLPVLFFFMSFSELISVCERVKEKKAVNYPGKGRSIGRFLNVILSNRALNSFMLGFAVRIYSKVFLLQNWMMLICCTFGL